MSLIPSQFEQAFYYSTNPATKSDSWPASLAAPSKLRQCDITQGCQAYKLVGDLLQCRATCRHACGISTKWSRVVQVVFLLRILGLAFLLVLVLGPGVGLVFLDGMGISHHHCPPNLLLVSVSMCLFRNRLPGLHQFIADNSPLL